MGEDKKVLGMRRNVFFLGLVSFFNDFSAEMVQSVMPAFLTTVLGAPAFFVGLIEGLADALASVLKLFSGWFSDKIGKRKLPAVLGYMLSVGVRPLLAMVQNVFQVLSLRVVDRVGKGFRDSPRDALIIESVPKSELGKSFGFHRSMDTLGATVGPLMAFFLLPVFGGNYRHLFLFAFVIGIGAVLSFVFVRETKKENGTRKSLPPLDFALFKRNKRFLLIVSSLFVFGLGTLPILLVLLKAKDLGLDGSVMPLFYFVYSLSFVIFAVPLGKFADAVGERKVIAAGFLLAAFAYFGMALSSSLVTTIFFFIVLGVYAAATDGLQRVIAAKHLESDLIATGQGFLNMAIGFSSLFAGVAGGILWTKFGSAAALSYAGFFSLIGFLLFLHMTKTHET